MKLIYHTLYRWFYFFESWGTPELSAMYILGLTWWMFAIGVIQLVRIAFGSPTIHIGEHFIAIIILFGLITLIIYWIYVRKGRFKEIDNYFNGEGGGGNSKGNIVTTVFLLLSIVLFFGIPLMENLNS